MNPILIQTFTAGAEVRPNRLVKVAAGRVATEGAASTDAIIGVANIPANTTVPTGKPVSVVLDGVAEVIAGGAITAGDPVTSDAAGAGVEAAPAAGVNARIVGFALESAVADDIVPVKLAPGQIQGA